MDGVLVGRDVFGGEAEVVLDVAVTADGLGQVVALEFVEDHAVRFVEDVGQDVEPAAVRHAHDDFADAGGSGALDDRVEHAGSASRPPRARTASGRRSVLARNVSKSSAAFSL